MIIAKVYTISIPSSGVALEEEEYNSTSSGEPGTEGYGEGTEGYP